MGLSYETITIFFRLFREVIMGHRDISWLTNKVPSIKERAEGNSMINGLAGKG